MLFRVCITITFAAEYEPADISDCICGTTTPASCVAAEDDTCTFVLVNEVSRLCAADACSCVIAACAAEACLAAAWTIAAWAEEARAVEAFVIAASAATTWAVEAWAVEALITGS